MSSSDSESVSDKDSSTSVLSSVAREITQYLSNQRKGTKKTDDEKKRNKTNDKDDPMEPFLTAARWIPLAIDPFITLHDVFLVGIQGRSGQRENMNKDKQYQCLMFEKIMLLVPNFASVLSEFYADAKTFEKFIKEMSKPISAVRSIDANAFKHKLPTYISPDEASRSNFIIPEVSNKAMWGWNHTVTARFLCPMRFIAKFDEDPEVFRERVQSGRRAIKASDYPMFLYDESRYTPGDIFSGLFQGLLLLKFYRHVFTGPSSWKTGASAGGKQARGLVHKLNTPTPRTIAYVAIMVRWALSSSTSYENQDQGFNLTEFYRNILTTFNECLDYDGNYELDKITEEWIATTLRWWQLNVPGLQRGSTSIDDDDSEDDESDLSKLKASQKTRASSEVDPIDPVLLKDSSNLPWHLHASRTTSATAQVAGAQVPPAQVLPAHITATTQVSITQVPPTHVAAVAQVPPTYATSQVPTAQVLPAQVPPTYITQAATAQVPIPQVPPAQVLPTHITAAAAQVSIAQLAPAQVPPAHTTAQVSIVQVPPTHATTQFPSAQVPPAQVLPIAAHITATTTAAQVSVAQLTPAQVPPTHITAATQNPIAQLAPVAPINKRSNESTLEELEDLTLQSSPAVTPRKHTRTSEPDPAAKEAKAGMAKAKEVKAKAAKKTKEIKEMKVAIRKSGRKKF